MFIGRILDNSIIIRLFLRFTNRSSSVLVSLELLTLESRLLAGRGLTFLLNNNERIDQ
jgi:hypothetical protein